MTGKWATNLLTAITAAAFLGGCTPAIQREPVGSRELTTPFPITQAELESRAARLARRVEQAQVGEKEKQAAMDLLNSYQIIGATLQPPLTEGDRQRVIRLLFESLSRLDEQIFQEATGQPPPPRPFDQYASLRREILDDFLASAYAAVVDKSLALQRAFGEEALTPDVGLLFSIALSKQGRTIEAINVGERVIRELDRKPDRLSLRASILEWQVAMGHERDAQESLRDLWQKVAEKETLLRQAQQKAGRKEPVEPPPPGGAGPGEDEPAAADAAALVKSLAEAKQLIERKEYTKAKFILLQQRIRFPEGPETASIDRMMEAIEAAEGNTGVEQTASPSGMDNAERIALARKLMEQEKYEDALARLEEIETQGGRSEELASLREVTTEKLINRERNNAARLFLMARSETNPEKRGELLSSSLNILRALLEKYPNSPSSRRINENMTTIREEINRVRKKAE